MEHVREELHDRRSLRVFRREGDAELEDRVRIVA